MASILTTTTRFFLSSYNKSDVVPEEQMNRLEIEKSDDPEERIITLEEVSWHDTYKDCWIVIYDRVYDVTDFLEDHPGGCDILMEYAGRDASVAFRGSGHSKQAVRALERFMVGELPMHERIFRTPGGYKLSDIPD